MNEVQISYEVFQEHRNLATQIATLYREIEKLAMKKPTESITPLVAKKINHVIHRVKDQIKGDEFLDAVETIPFEGEMLRQDEVMIILGELNASMDRVWESRPFISFRKSFPNIHYQQVLRGQ